MEEEEGGAAAAAGGARREEARAEGEEGAARMEEDEEQVQEVGGVGGWRASGGGDLGSGVVEGVGASEEERVTWGREEREGTRGKGCRRRSSPDPCTYPLSVLASSPSWCHQRTRVA